MFLCLVLEGNACFLFHIVSGGLLLSDPGEATTKQRKHGEISWGGKTSSTSETTVYYG